MDTRSNTNLRKLKAKLALHNLSYRKFAELHGFKERTVKAAVRGERNGKFSRAIAKLISNL
jgi:hypothetical protein